jgi:hypothetical protein
VPPADDSPRFYPRRVGVDAEMRCPEVSAWVKEPRVALERAGILKAQDVIRFAEVACTTSQRKVCLVVGPASGELV